MRRLSALYSFPALMLVLILGATTKGDGQEREALLTPQFVVLEVPDLPEQIRDYQLGRHGATLIVAGGLGADGSLSDAIYTLPAGAGEWRLSGRLPEALVNSGAASTGGGMLLIGGRNQTGPSNAVLLLSVSGSDVSVKELAKLPFPMERPAATVAGGTVYVAGAAAGKPAFLSLSLGAPEEGWQELPPWPGPAREGGLLAYSFESIHLIGGYWNGQALLDAYSWHPRKGWREATPPPSWGRFTTGAELGESHIFVFEGEDAAGAGNPEIHAYHSLTDSWTLFGKWENEGPRQPRAVTIGDTILVMSGQSGSRVQILPPENNYGWVDHVVVAIYLMGMVAMGAWFVRKERDTTDYFRASRKAPWWAIGMSLFATAASAISLMTMPGKSYSTDWTYFSITIFSVLCLPLSLFLLAPLVRKLNIATANEYLELRFGVVARVVGSVIYMINQILARMAPIIFLPSIAMAAITDIDIWVWILVIGTVTTLYTFLGGLAAVIWTDTIQGLIMVATVAACLVLILFKLEMPFDEAWATLQANGKFHTFDVEWDVTYPTVWMVFIGTVFITLLGVGDQNFVQRVQAAPSLRDAKKAVATQMAVAVPINVLLFGLGTALYLYYRQHPEQLNPVMKTDGVYPLFAAQQLPPGVSGLVIAALLAASMSTISSAICSVANLGVDDFYRRFNKRATEQSALQLGRVLSILVGILGTGGAWYLSTTDSRSIWDLALLISGLITNGAVGLFGLGLLTRRAHESAALIGILVGMIVIFFLQRYTAVTFWLYAPLGSTVTFVVGYVLSLVLPGKPNHLEGLTVYTLDRPRPHL